MTPRYLSVHRAYWYQLSRGYGADGGTGYFMGICRILGTCFLCYIHDFLKFSEPVQVTSNILYVFIGPPLPLVPWSLGTL